MSGEKIKTIELAFVNVFLVRVDGGFILIDSGLPSHWDKLEGELRSAGCLPDKLRLVIVTHGDRDHTGNCAKLQKTYRAPVAMHRADLAMARDGARVKRRMRTMGARVISLLGRLRKKDFETFTPDVFLTDGQSLQEYGFDATVLHVPGHTKGSIAVLTTGGELFVGDTFVNNKRPGVASYIENDGELATSVDRLKGVKSTRVYPGHGRPFSMTDMA